MSAGTQSTVTRTGRELNRRFVGVELVVMVTAFAARISVVLHSGGFRGSFGYDASVYYAASDALSHGRLPYRDYTLVHPPGIALALLPFVLFGRITSDHLGFAVATLAWMLLGSINAMLVVRIARRIGLGAPGALVGGMCYGLWLGSVNAEFLIRLEPLGNFCILCGLLAFLAAENTGGRSASFACGLGFGAAAGVKIWWIVPLGVVIAWHLCRSRRARLPVLIAGACAALLAIDGPFFAVAPRQMTSMVLFDQLGRYRASTLLDRVLTVGSVDQLGRHLSRPMALAIAAFVVCVFLALTAMAWAVPAGRLAATMLCAQLITLLSGPSWYTFYADFIAPCLAIMIAVAVRPRRADHRAAPAAAKVAARTRGAVAVVVIGLWMSADIVLSRQAVRPFPFHQLAASVAQSRCVMSDSPMPLIQLDVLSSDLDHGCANWVDVSARTYGVDAASASGKHAARRLNPKWQADLQRYLFSGDTVLLFRPRVTGIGAPLRELLHSEPVLARSDGIAVIQTPHCTHLRFVGILGGT